MVIGCVQVIDVSVIDTIRSPVTKIAKTFGNGLPVRSVQPWEKTELVLTVKMEN